MHVGEHVFGAMGTPWQSHVAVHVGEQPVFGATGVTAGAMGTP